MPEHEKIAIIGDGAWGTAMAMVLLSSGRSVRMWSHDAAYLERMRQSRRNQIFLPNLELPPELEFEADAARAMEWADLVVTAVPSKFLRDVLAPCRGALAEEKPVLSLTKGFDAESLLRPSQLIADCLGAKRVAALSGPSHAEEVARRLPASVVVASEELALARQIQQVVTTSRFRVYASRDIVGVEVAGAMKNVIALAAGLLHGMNLGDNALAALTTRGLVEMVRLGVRLGADAPTFSGLAGMGDLITTCISPHSRNRRVGKLLAEGKNLDAILADMKGIPESVTTTRLALELARKHHVELPITEQVAAVLWEGKPPEQALDELMTRARKDED